MEVKVAVCLDCDICFLITVYPVQQVLKPGNLSDSWHLLFSLYDAIPSSFLSLPRVPFPVLSSRQNKMGHFVGNAELIIVVFHHSCPSH